MVVVKSEPVFTNFSAFVQDEWKATRRLSLSLGLRWDVNPAPGNEIGYLPYRLNQITNLATATVAPTNSPLWDTDWRGFAPRFGLAYQLGTSSGHETVLRAGFGLFYDLNSLLASFGFSNYLGFATRRIFRSPLSAYARAVDSASGEPGAALPGERPGVRSQLAAPLHGRLECYPRAASGPESDVDRELRGFAWPRSADRVPLLAATLGNANFSSGVRADVVSNRGEFVL